MIINQIKLYSIDLNYNVLSQARTVSKHVKLPVRRQTNHPIMLDEIIDGPPDLIRAINDRALDIVVLKLAHMGGLTPAALMARLCRESGIRKRIEDTVG